MFDKNTTRCLGVAEPKSWKQCCDRRLPTHAVFIDEFGKQQCCHRLRILGHYEQSVAVWLLCTTKFLDSKAISEDALAVLY